MARRVWRACNNAGVSSPFSLNDDDLRLMLLKRCLVAGDANKDTLCVVLSSFADESYHGVLPYDKFRKILHTVDLQEVAELISNLGFST